MRAGAQAALDGLADRFGGPRASGGRAEGRTGIALRWGQLYEALGGPQADYAGAVELMYEGYLLHYRESRVLPSAVDDGETALLAGDSAYAEGLRLVAGCGDVASVTLLSRLMSACAFLRDEGLAFALDDALWAYTVAAMAASGGAAGIGRAGASAGTDETHLLYDQVDEAFRDGRGGQVADLVAAAVPRLCLTDATPLAAALATEGS